MNDDTEVSDLRRIYSGAVSVTGLRHLSSSPLSQGVAVNTLELFQLHHGNYNCLPASVIYRVVVSFYLAKNLPGGTVCSPWCRFYRPFCRLDDHGNTRRLWQNYLKRQEKSLLENFDRKRSKTGEIQIMLVGWRLKTMWLIEPNRSVDHAIVNFSFLTARNDFLFWLNPFFKNNLDLWWKLRVVSVEMGICWLLTFKK